MSAINEIASLWMEGTMRTLDAFRTGFGATMDDPPPAKPTATRTQQCPRRSPAFTNSRSGRDGPARIRWS